MQYRLFTLILLCMLAFAAISTFRLQRLAYDVAQTRQAVSALEDEQQQQRAIIDNMALAAVEQMQEIQGEIELFIPGDIPLDPRLQEVTWELCNTYPVPIPGEEFYDLVLRVMWHESGYLEHVPDNRNANGTLDRGLMQINSVNWSWLAREGLDVNVTEENIEAGVHILALFLNRYGDVEHALTAYAYGEGGAAARSGKSRFSQEILSMDLPEQT